jgi:deoxyhypusine synthase
MPASPIKKQIMRGRRILPKALTGKESLADVVDNAFSSYNSGRIREACKLFSSKMLEPNVTVDMSLAGAMTPAGLGPALLVPLIEAGFVDWIISTGANMYHDLHFALNYPLVSTAHTVDDRILRENDLVRVYDVVFGFSDCLIATDEALRGILRQPEFAHTMGTAELHHRIGRYAAEYERKNKLPHVSVLAAAHRCQVPIYTSSPGDSTIGMNVAALRRSAGWRLSRRR